MKCFHEFFWVDITTYLIAMFYFFTSSIFGATFVAHSCGHFHRLFVTFSLNHVYWDSRFFTDGDSDSPDYTSGGDIGKAIGGKHGLIRTPMNKRFKKIRSPVPDHIDIELLQNKDLKNMHALCILLKKGPRAAKKILAAFFCVPGKVNQSRWITMVNNVMVHYLQQTNPTPELILLVKFITNVYIPAFIKIKQEPHISNGPKHLFNIYNLSKKLLKEETYPSRM